MAHRGDGLSDIFEHNVIIREKLQTTSGTIQAIPVDDKDIVNKSYCDSNSGGITLVASNPASADEGTLILNTSNNSIYVYYLGEWRLLHTLTIADEFLLLENGDFILLENGDKIIKD